MAKLLFPAFNFPLHLSWPYKAISDTLGVIITIRERDPAHLDPLADGHETLVPAWNQALFVNHAQLLPAFSSR